MEVLKVEKVKVDEPTKSSFQDSFCLVRHQILSHYPYLDISFLRALNIPKELSSSWSKSEFLNLLEHPPSIEDVGDDENDSEDAGVEEPEDGEANP